MKKTKIWKKMREISSFLPKSDQSDDLAFLFALNARHAYHKVNLEKGTQKNENFLFISINLQRKRRVFRRFLTRSAPLVQNIFRSIFPLISLQILKISRFFPWKKNVTDPILLQILADNVPCYLNLMLDRKYKIFAIFFANLLNCNEN